MQEEEMEEASEEKGRSGEVNRMPLPLLQLTKKKASKNDTPLEKEMRRFNKLVKELEEQERENNLQKTEDEAYQQLFGKKVHPLLVELAQVQLRFIEKLESIFYAGKFSKSQERIYLAFAIPVLQDAGHYLHEAKDKLDNYINWQETLSPVQDDYPLAKENNEPGETSDDETEYDDYKKYPKNNQAASPEIEKKSVSELYKELAKLIHPDLEQDETIRYQKEQLMKELTAAKDKEDVHAMLLIQQKAAVLNNTEGSEKGYSLQLLKMYNNSMKKKLEALKRSLQQQVFRSFGSKESFYAHGRKKIPVEARIKNDINSIKELQQNLLDNMRIISAPAHLRELLQQL